MAEVRDVDVGEEGVPGAGLGVGVGIDMGCCSRESGQTERTSSRSRRFMAVEMAQDVDFPFFGVCEGLVAVEDVEEAGIVVVVCLRLCLCLCLCLGLGLGIGIDIVVVLRH